MDISGLSTAQQRAARSIVDKCIHSRLYFIQEILEVDLEDWQQEVIEELDSGETKISIRSGHGVGKTMLVAVLAVHFLAFRDDVKVIVTSPSSDQMKDGLIPEISKWISRMPTWMSASLNGTSERVVRYPDDKNNFISFRTARKENPEALQGVHATHVMILVDEASGVDEAVYEAGQGSLSTEGSIAILIGNPTRPYGFFYKTQTVLADLWWTKKVSCFDSKRVDPNYIISQARTYGVDSKEYRVRVLGEFPDTGADSVIPRSFIENALNREIDQVSGDIVWGVDPGRGGDPTGFVERSANLITEKRELRYDDLMQVVGWIYNRYNKIPHNFRPVSIYVDSVGLGAGVADRLLELGLPVVHVNVGESASMSDRFYNLRAELAYAFRDWLESREVGIVRCELDDKFVDQCVSVEEKPDSVKVQLKPKSQTRSVRTPSPNLFDATIITFAYGADIRIGNYSQGWSANDKINYHVPNLVMRRK